MCVPWLLGSLSHHNSLITSSSITQRDFELVLEGISRIGWRDSGIRYSLKGSLSLFLRGSQESSGGIPAAGGILAINLIKREAW